MNFHNIPELEASVLTNGHEVYNGYFIVLGVLAAVSVGLYRAFRKSGWL